MIKGICGLVIFISTISFFLLGLYFYLKDYHYIPENKKIFKNKMVIEKSSKIWVKNYGEN